MLPSHRVVGGAVAGGALLALAYARTPCCAGCAAAGAGIVTAPPATTAGPAPIYAAATLGDMMNVTNNGYYSGAMSPTDAGSGCTTCFS